MRDFSASLSENDMIILRVWLQIKEGKKKPCKK